MFMSMLILMFMFVLILMLYFVVYVYVDTDVHAYVDVDARVQAIMQSASATAPWGVITKEESLLRGLR